MKVSNLLLIGSLTAVVIETPILLGLVVHYKQVKQEKDYYSDYVNNADFFFNSALKIVDDSGIDSNLINVTAEQLKLASQRQSVTSVEDYETSTKVKKEKSKITTEEWLNLAMQGLSTIASGVSGAVKMSNSSTVAAAKAT